MAVKNIILKNNGDNLYPQTSIDNIIGLSGAITTVSLTQDYPKWVMTSEVPAEDWDAFYIYVKCKAGAPAVCYDFGVMDVDCIKNDPLLPESIAINNPGTSELEFHINFSDTSYEGYEFTLYVNDSYDSVELTYIPLKF